ncbi:adenosylcobinamide-GDP ribazoletransferase [Pannonibacter carbonis]|uniref:adenosylcobinamide-GDP ribazoletransferase n=1 Tax=Pannonibacter carbonis TaxID=2067569 RepID=UPI000D112B04|nr:adenosylcobinamide-GDP ribazoletransferase [Pannonibacter carbonis]
MQQNDTGGGLPVPPALARLAADTAACLRFFTRLPVPSVGPLDDPAAAPDFRVIARAMPLAGAVLATGPALLWLVLQMTALPPMASAALVLASLIALTGALHEDGLGDIADGFFGGATRERRLEIMKDSRIGAFAAIALALSLILKVALLAALPERFGVVGSLLLLIGMEAVSRLLCLWQWAQLPSARPDGLAARFGIPGMDAVLNGLGLTALVLLPLVFVLPFLSLVCGLAAGALAAHAAGRLAWAKIGGFTGDVIGAVQQLSALAFLLGVLVLA